MNDLKRISTTESGQGLYLFPHAGHLFYFEKVGPRAIRLHMVDVMTDVDQRWDEWSTFDELPATVRSAIVRSPWRMRPQKTTLEGAMS